LRNSFLDERKPTDEGDGAPLKKEDSWSAAAGQRGRKPSLGKKRRRSGDIEISIVWKGTSRFKREPEGSDLELALKGWGALADRGNERQEDAGPGWRKKTPI